MGCGRHAPSPEVRPAVPDACSMAGGIAIDP
jgi:hypothetical protein